MQTSPASLAIFYTLFA